MDNKIKETKYSGRDCLMTCGDSTSMRALKLAYRKHVLNDGSIGWDELGAELGSALAQVMGDDEFCDWVDSIKNGM